MPRHKKKASASRSPYPSNAGHRTHRNFPQDVAREILRAFRYGRDLTLLMIEVTRPKGMGERLAYKGADSLSRFFEPHLRNTDFHFSSSSDHLFLLLPETPEKGGLVLGSRLVETFEKAPLPPSGDSLPGTAVVQIHAGVSAVGMGGHTELDLIATSEIAARAARLFSSPVVTLNQLVGGRFSLLEWVGLYSTLSETEVLVLSRVFERLRKEPFGFMQKIASQVEALSDRLKLDLDDRDALAFWIYALDLVDIAKAEPHSPLPEIAEHSNRKKSFSSSVDSNCSVSGHPLPDGLPNPGGAPPWLSPCSEARGASRNISPFIRTLRKKPSVLIWGNSPQGNFPPS